VTVLMLVSITNRAGNLPSGRIDGKQRWKRFRTKHAAKAYQDAVRTQVRDGAYTAVKPVLMGAVMDQWLTQEVDRRVDEQELSPNTARLYRLTVDTHLRPAFATVRSDRLTPALISRWRLGQAALVAAGKAAPSSVGMRLTVLKTILKWARAGSQRYMGHDPAAEQKAPGGRAPEREILTPEEIDILLQAAPPPDDTILRLAAYSGLRRGEIFGLQWSDIDMERGTVSVRRTWVNGVLRRPKTAKSARTIDVPQPLLDDLNAYMMMYPPLGDGFGIPHPTRGAAEARRVAQGAAEETGEIVGADGATLWVAYSATPVLHDAVGCGRGGPEVREHSAGPQHHRHHGGHLHACAP
jgi:integrase